MKFMKKVTLKFTFLVVVMILLGSCAGNVKQKEK